jgi:hypothetical protein
MEGVHDLPDLLRFSAHRKQPVGPPADELCGALRDCGAKQARRSFWQGIQLGIDHSHAAMV